MGIGASCPQGFEDGNPFMCHVKCPEGFVYIQDRGDEKCMLLSDTSKVVKLTSFSKSADATPEIEAERKRVNAELLAILTKSQSNDMINKYESIQSRYAEFADFSGAIEQTVHGLRPKRPPTAPVDDLSLERELILQGPGIDIVVIQLALFLAVLAIISFLVLPRDTAQGLTFLLLCTGVAIGFFLRK